MASGSAEGGEDKTWVLKVSVHCEGCKKNLRKVLQRVEGVHKIDIDSNQNRVTVIGKVEGDTLVQRLLKYGKRAELFRENKKGTSDSSAAPSKTELQRPNAEKKKKPDAKEGKASASPSEIAEAARSPEELAPDSPDESATESPEKSGSDSQEKSSAAASDEATPPNNPKTEESEKNETEEANGGKKKGKKKQIEEKNREDETPAPIPLHPPAEYPFAAYRPPEYLVSYSTVHPSTSYAYYAAPPPEIFSSNAYPVYQPESVQLPEYYPSDSFYRSIETPANSFDMFNDENPNACTVM